MKPLIITLLFILIVLSQINTIMETDIWFHLKAGEYIFNNKEVPRADIFSYSVSGRPWINHEWFTQLTFYSVHRFFGFNGLTILKAIIAFLIFFLIFKLCYKKANFSILVLFLIASILTFSYRSLIRPELFSYFFFTIYIFILERHREISEKRLFNADIRGLHADSRRFYRRGYPRPSALHLRKSAFKRFFQSSHREKKKGLLFFLPLLQIVWTNMHGYFLLGIILSFIYLFQELIKRDLKAWGVFLLLLISTLINPNSLAGSIYPLQILRGLLTSDLIFKKTVAELRMPVTIEFGRLLFYWVLISMTLFTFLLNLKKVQLFYIILFLLGFILSYSSLRDIPYLAILAIPVAINNLKALGFKENRKTYPPLIFLIAMCVFSFITNFFYKNESDFRRFGFVVSELPKAAGDFIEKRELKGRVFNSFLFGGYLVYRLFPKRKVFIDGRTELYGQTIYQFYRDAHYYPYAWQELVWKYNINFCVIQHIFTGSEAIIRYLYKSKDWALIFFDRVSVIFIRDIPENSYVVENFRWDINKIKEDEQCNDLRIARFFEILEERDAAERIYNNILREDKDSYKAKNALGVLYLRRREFEEAYRIFTELLSRHKNKAEVYHNLGLAMLKLGKRREAKAYFEKSLKIDPNFRYSHYVFGELNFEEGFFETAKNFFKQYLTFDPYDSKAYYYLGTIELRLKNFKGAIGELKEAVSLAPEDYLSHNNLGVAYIALNRKLEAEREWRKALEISPGFEPAKENLKRLMNEDED